MGRLGIYFGGIANKWDVGSLKGKESWIDSFFFFLNGTIVRIMLFTDMGSMVGVTGLRTVLEFLTWLSWRGLLCNLNRKLEVVV